MTEPPREPLALIVAMAKNRCIGAGGTLPWHLPEDLAHFRSTTMGHAILMGRRTWASIGRALPGRRTIIVSRTLGEAPAGTTLYADLAEALAAARATDAMPFVIGGGELYRAALPLATDLHLTEIDRVVDGDTFFPAFDRSEWREVERRPGADASLLFLHLKRR